MLTDDRNSQWPIRALLLGLLLGLWFVCSMANASVGTSWESHPFGGPFILLKESRSPLDFAMAGVIFLAILAPAIDWVRTEQVLTAIVAAAAAAFAICLSIFVAASASC